SDAKGHSHRRLVEHGLGQSHYRHRCDRPAPHAARAGHPAFGDRKQTVGRIRVSTLEGRLVVLGVTGSIAAYKSAELARALTAAGAEVQPMMTHSAQAFLGALTLQTLTRHKPMTEALELLP